MPARRGPREARRVNSGDSPVSVSLVSLARPCRPCRARVLLADYSSMKNCRSRIIQDSPGAASLVHSCGACASGGGCAVDRSDLM